MELSRPQAGADDGRNRANTAAAENIAVCIRVRPLNEREKRNQDVSVLATVPQMKLISVTDTSGAPLGGKSNVFQYDDIFDASSDAYGLYDRAARRIVRSTLDGINGTIFAYGQTSSGKTYTMQGDGVMPFERASESPGSSTSVPRTPGMLQLAVEDIFNYIEGCTDRDFLLRVSFLEIYNEVIKDLLNPTEKGANLKLREDPRKGVYVECKEEIITNYEDILNLLQLGNQRRTVGHTAMNERSSRSHSVFRVVIESKQKSDSRRQSEEDVNGAVLVASLNLVDLAGSESLRHTAAEGIRQREAGNINKSLLTLARVINSLAGSGGGQNAPFRDSKLTRLLQNSLGGNTRTLIICCVTPSDRFLEETRSTLQFAARAKDIQTSATVNEVLDDQAQLKRLKREVHELKKLVKSDALDALKAENEALLSEKSHNKAEMARLMGLILSSTTVTKFAVGKKRKQRGKRARETWCPGDFAAAAGNMKQSAALSPSLPPRKRHSPAKENVDPQTLLQVLEGTEEELEDVEDDADGSGKKWESTGVKESNKKVLDLFSAAFRKYREGNSEDPVAAAEASIGKKSMRLDDIERARVSELLGDVKALMAAGTQSKAALEEKQALDQEVQCLRAKLEQKQLDGGLSSAEKTSEPGSLVEELRRELAVALEGLAKEKERAQNLELEKENLEKMANEETKVLNEQLETLRFEFNERQKQFESEKREFEAAVHESVRGMQTPLSAGMLSVVPESEEVDDDEEESGPSEMQQKLSYLERQLEEAQTALALAKEGQPARKNSSEGESESDGEDLEKQLAAAKANEAKLAAEVEALRSSTDNVAGAGGNVLSMASELQDMLKELAQLQSDYESTEAEKNEIQAEADRIMQEMEAAQRQASEMSETVAEKDHYAKVLQAQLDAKIMTISQLHDKHSGEVETLQQTIQSVTAEKEQLTLKMQALGSGEKGDSEDASAEGQDEMKRLIGEVEKLTSAKAELEAKVQTLQSELEQATTQLSAANEEKVEANESSKGVEASGSESEVGMLREEKRRLEEKLQELEAQQQSGESQPKPEWTGVEAEGSANGANSAINQSQDLSGLLQTMSELEASLGEMRAEYERMCSEKEALESENSKLLESLAEVETHMKTPSAEVAEAKTQPASDATAHPAQSQSELEEALKTLRSDFEALEKSKAEADSTLEKLNAEKLSLEERLAVLSASDAATKDIAADQTLQQRFEAMEEEHKRMTDDLEKASRERDDCMDELRALESQLMEVSEEKMKLAVAVEEHAAELRETRRLSSSSDEMAALQTRLDEEQAAKTALENRKSELEQEVEKTQLALAALRADYDTVVKSLEQREAESSSANGESTSEVEKLQKRLDTEVELRQKLELDVKSYEETLTVLRNDAKGSSHASADLVEKLKLMQEELAAASRAQQAKENEVSVLTKELEQAREEQQELRLQSRQRLVAVEAKEMELDEKLEMLQKQLHGESTSSDELAASKAKQTELQDKLEILEQQLAESQQALTTQEEQWATKLDAAEKELACMTTKQKDLHEQLAALQSEADDAQKSIKDQAEELMEVKRTYTEALEQKKTAERALAAVEAEMQQKGEDTAQKASAEMASVREQLQDAQQELDAYQKYADEEIHRLRTSIEQMDTEMAELKQATQAKEEAFERQITEQEDWRSQVQSRQELLQAKCDELDEERQILKEKHAALETQHEEAAQKLREEARELAQKYEEARQQHDGAAERVKEMKTKMEAMEGEAYQRRGELEELSESLKSSQMEAEHYHNQLVEAKLAKESLEKLVETQKARIDKLDKVKMTTDTLDLFRKLKRDRQELQERVTELQEELDRSLRSSAKSQEEESQLLQRKEEDLTVLRQHIEELQQSLRTEKHEAANTQAEMRRTFRDEREKAEQELQDMQALLKDKSAQVETLEAKMNTLEDEQAKIRQMSSTMAYLEKENLELLMENREMKKRLV